MSDIFSTASQLILTPAGLQQADLEKTLAQVVGGDVDFADLYFQNTRHESWVLEDRIVKEGSFNIDSGVGIRAIANDKTGFSYTSDVSMDTLTKAAAAARSIVKSGQSAQVALQSAAELKSLYAMADPIASLEQDAKVALLKETDELCRGLDSRVKEVTVSLSGVYDVVLVACSDGTFAADIRPLIRFNVSVLVEENGRRERGGAGSGGRFSYDQLHDATFTVLSPKDVAKEAVRVALVNLEAQAAPAGAFPVVLGPGWPGVLLHEAVGHGLEGDFNRKGSSAFSGRIGEKVASPLCTVVDDGTIVNRRGSLSMDDEGSEPQNTVLIENGILRGYMQDKMNAKLMNQQVTGNGRRQSYAHLPLPRMTNTYMLAGDSDPEEIIATIDRGIYAVNFGGGQVDITSGKFVFSTSEAYLVEKGKIRYPVKGATLIGSGPEVMQKVSMVGNDLKLDPGIGTCGKEGQSVPVGVGQPTLKIDEITVGGTG